jgi:hypothetical protein
LNNNAAALKSFGVGGFANTTDSTYAGIRQLAKTLNINLEQVAG